MKAAYNNLVNLKANRQGHIGNILFVTSNKGKFDEVNMILHGSATMARAELEEIQSDSTRKVAIRKAIDAYEKFGAPLVVEDTGLYIKGLGGFPGPMVKWTVGMLGKSRLCKIASDLKSRSAYAETCIVFYDGKKVRVFSGIARGSISARPKGKRGFGWDSIFIPYGQSRTFAEMTAEEKNRISHRGIACRKLRDFLVGKGRIRTGSIQY